MSNIVARTIKRAFQNGLTIAELSEISEIPQPTLYRWIKRLPKCLEQFEKLKKSVVDFEKSKNPK